jgi:uncharacterized glyoxalase superfamily protein PhnB
MTRVIPVFRIFDREKADAFYIDWLGFKTDWEHRFEANTPVYLQISKDDIVLHLTEHHGDCTPGAKAFIEYSGLETYCAELKAKAYRYYRPSVETSPWNSRIMEVTDPFGNKLLFNETLES